MSLRGFTLLELLVAVAVVVIPFPTPGGDGPAPAAPRLVETRKIWDKAPHNAFTDLIRFNDRWFCAFREGGTHVSTDGALRVITSKDGKEWESAALLTSDTSDLRDPKLSITPDGRLMLLATEALHDKARKAYQSLTWFSTDGRKWEERTEVGEPDFWLWRVAWHGKKAYGVGYGCAKDLSVRLYASGDGKKFDAVVTPLHDKGEPNEAALVLSGDSAWCLLRREGNPISGLLGISRAPFDKWEWKDTRVRIGGPALTRLPDGRLCAAVRLYDKKTRTSLCWIDPDTGGLTEFLELPPAGGWDTGYAGLAWHDGLLWVSYYSQTHEGAKTSIYLVKVEIPKAAK